MQVAARLVGATLGCVKHIGWDLPSGDFMSPEGQESSEFPKIPLFLPWKVCSLETPPDRINSLQNALACSGKSGRYQVAVDYAALGGGGGGMYLHPRLCIY